MARLCFALTLFLAAGCAGLGGGEERIGPLKKKEAAKINAELGFGYLKQDRFDVAEEKFDRALEFNPYNATAAFGKGILLYKQGKTIEGRKAVDRAAKSLAKDEKKLRDGIAEWYCNVGAIESARAVLRDGLVTGNSDEILRMSQCYARNGDLARAESELLAGLERTPTSGVLLLGMAGHSLRVNDPLRAQSFMRRYERVAPLTSQGALLGIRIAARLGDEKSRLAYAQALERLSPSASQQVDLQTGELR